MTGFVIDTSVLLDVLARDARWFAWSTEALTRGLAAGELGINAVIYAEVAAGYRSQESCDAVLATHSFAWWDLPREAAFLAGPAHLAYRRSGGERTSTLPDFFIGAHAAVTGVTLITRDPRRVATAFPRLALLEPKRFRSDLRPPD